jgi:hypothetical protein
MHRLKKKYGPAMEDVMAHLERCREELNASCMRRKGRRIMRSAAREAERYERRQRKFPLRAGTGARILKRVGS